MFLLSFFAAQENETFVQDFVLVVMERREDPGNPAPGSVSVITELSRYMVN